jgi:photosystem II stability/assembly factor-like uncharacterized protein
MAMIRYLLLTTALIGVLTAAAFPQPKWVQQASGTSDELRTIAFSDSLVGVAIGHKGTSLRTTNGGLTWSTLANDLGGYIYDLDILPGGSFVAVGSWDSPWGGGNMWCDSAGVWKSTDSGASWKRQIPLYAEPPHSAISLEVLGASMPSDSVWYTLGGCGQLVCSPWGGTHLFRSTNGGSTWQYTPTEICDSGWASVGIAFLDDSVGVMLGGRGAIFRTTDSGNTVESIPSGTEALLFNVMFRPDGRGIIVGDSGVILQSTDGGLSWDRKPSGTTVFLISAVFLDSSRGFAVGGSGTVLSTIDGGESWSAESSGTTAALFGISFVDEQHVWISGEGGTILKRSIFRAAVVPDTEYYFGSVSLGSVIIDSIAVINTGTLPVDLTYGSDTPEFIPFDAGQTIQPGDTSHITVMFAPLAAGDRTGHLTINHDVGGPAWEVRLTAKGIEWDTSSFQVRNSWNIISIHRDSPEDSTVVVFPSAITSAYRYEWNSGYVISDTLTPGSAYWLKFPSDDAVTMAGYTVANDTMYVRTGWNMVGTVASIVPVSTIRTTPPTLITSGFYGYDAGYHPVDTLVPGRGYWVKVGADGYIYLNAP